MKITKKQLQRIIKEELNQLLSEGPDTREDLIPHASDPYSPYHEMAVSALKAEIPPLAQVQPRQEIAPTGAPGIHDYPYDLGIADEINRQEFGESFPFDIGKAAVALDYKQTFDKCVKANNGDLKPCI